MRAARRSVAGLAEQAAGERRGRHQRRRELHRFERERAGAVAIVVRVGFERARGQQHGALAPVGVAIDQAALHVAVEPLQRADPVAGGAARVEHRERRPGRRARRAVRPPRHRRLAAAASLRRCASMIEPVQAEQPRVVARRHGVEGALGGVAVAGQLRRLRAEQQRQRLVRRDARRLVGESARGAHVAGADRDQALRHRVIAAHAAPHAQIEAAACRASAGSRGRSTTASLTSTATTATATTSAMTEVSIRSPAR